MQVLISKFKLTHLEPDDGGLWASVDEAVESEGVPLQLVDRTRARVDRRAAHHDRRAVVPARVQRRREVLTQRTCGSG